MSTHADAVEAAIAAARGLTQTDEPLVALARTLARQLDAAGTEGPGTRLASTYLTTLRTLMARIGPSDAAATSTLAELRAKRQQPKPTKKRRAVTRPSDNERNPR